MDTETVCVVGVGNVAVDLARMILTPIDILRWGLKKVLLQY